VRGTPTPYKGTYQRWNSGYFFSLSNTGQYAVHKVSATAETAVQPWTTAAALTAGSGAFNTIKVKAQNGTLTLYLNGVQVWTKTFASFIASGQVGLAIYRGTGEGTNAMIADYVKLGPVGSLPAGKHGGKAISEEQKALNREARANPHVNLRGPGYGPQ